VLIHNWTGTFRLLCTLIVTTPFLTGCWDRMEVDQRANILGISIDTVDPSSVGSKGMMGSSNATGYGPLPPQTDTLMKLTAQLAVPGRIPLGPGESGGGGTSPKSAVWVLNSYGKTLNDALQQLQQQVADKIFLGHVRVIVVSEAFAQQQGLQTLIDTLRRNPQVRRTAWLVISKGNADEVMKSSPPLERVPTLYLMSTMDHARQMGKLPNDFLGVFESKSVMKGREPILPYLEVMQEDNINVAGLAFFKGYKMVGTTKQAFDISSYMELDGVKAGGYTVMVSLPGHSGAVMWHDYHRKRKISVDIRNGRPHFTVNIHLDGNIAEKSEEGFSIDNPEILKAIDAEIAGGVQKHVNDFIEQLKQEDVDIVGFGEYVRAKQPRYWDHQIRTREKWEEIYPEISVDTHVTVRTHRVGMKGT
jgi:spore germination protein KC